MNQWSKKNSKNPKQSPFNEIILKKIEKVAVGLNQHKCMYDGNAFLNTFRLLSHKKMYREWLKNCRKKHCTVYLEEPLGDGWR
jgi:hypothetical protein